MDVLPFVAGTVSLLAIPGPTNTLLAASGASVGWSRSLHLLAAELGGYMLAILALRALLAPLMGRTADAFHRVAHRGRNLPDPSRRRVVAPWQARDQRPRAGDKGHHFRDHAVAVATWQS